MNYNLAASSPHDCENPSAEEEIKRKMYRAVLGGDWAEAKKLIDQTRKVALGPITEAGDRALHLSVAMKHEKFAQELIELMNEDELVEVDGRGQTACCYAAISDEMTAIAQKLIDKNSHVLSHRNREDNIPLQMASLNGKRNMISFLISSMQKKEVPHETLTDDEWLELLLSAISTKMYDIALQILAYTESMGKSLAIHTKKVEETETTKTTDTDKEITETTKKTDADKEGIETTKKTDADKEGTETTKKKHETAMHKLARQELTETSATRTEILMKSILGTTFYGRQIYGVMKPASRDFAAKLLEKMKESGNEKEVVDVLQKPPILCEAAKVGNVELIVMLARVFPDLLWQKDTHNRSLFHYAVMYRQDAVFGLIRQIGGLKNIVVMGTDADGNNILHLAAKLAHANARNSVVSIPALQMQRELAWFKEVEGIVPVTFGSERNKAGLKPRKLFSKEHESLLKESEVWMKSTADSCMLIATIILTVVYAAAFTVPGGNNSDTGLPILMRSTWFTCFFVFEALALFGSTLCVIVFWSITSSGFKEERFLDILPYQLKLGLSGLFGSLIGAISAFMSAYCLVLVDERAWAVKGTILVIYVMLILAVCGRFSELWFKMKLPKSLNRMLSNLRSQTLFSEESSS